MGIIENGCMAIQVGFEGLVVVSGMSRFFKFFVRRALLVSALLGILEWLMRVCRGTGSIVRSLEAHGKSRIPHLRGPWPPRTRFGVPEMWDPRGTLRTQRSPTSDRLRLDYLIPVTRLI